MSISSEFMRANAGHLAHFFEHTGMLSVVRVDDNLRIIGYNACCERNIWQGRDVSGVYLPELLAPESREVLPLAQDTDAINAWLNFAPEGAQAVRVNVCILRTKPEGYMLLGGELLLSSTEALEKMTLMSNELANMARDLRRKNTELQQAQAQIKTLEGIIPICMHCKEIRDDEGYWVQLEKYISEHSDAQLSHGICDKCLEQHYP
ncbi:MAG: hypothetical protein LC645_04055, partial [Geobacteraceae bacterium]|nr:hypothetical protein [Geobacteraceae bacterium]